MFFLQINVFVSVLLIAGGGRALTWKSQGISHWLGEIGKLGTVQETVVCMWCIVYYHSCKSHKINITTSTVK